MGERRQAREKAAYQFHIQAGGVGYRIVQRLSPYRFQVLDLDDYTQRHYTAVVLPETFDFYTYRLFKGKRRTFDLLIVQRHNAVVPVDVVDLATGGKYFPGDKVEGIVRANGKRRNADEKALLLSQIICGTKDGKETLKAMPDRMRQRYLREAQSYLRGRVGRPFTS